MNPKLLLAIAAVISSIAALVGVFYKKHEAPPPPAASQSQSGAGNVQISGTGNTVQVGESASSKQITECVGFFPDLDDLTFSDGKPFRDKPEEYIRYPAGADFYKCVVANEGRLLKLRVWLGDKHLKIAQEYLKSDKKVYFHIGSMYRYSPQSNYYTSDGGAEYLLDLGTEADTNFVPHPRRLNTITGFYKVSNVMGPFQGAMSIALKGVRIEDVPSR